jgi:hypothetical protein
VGVRPSTRPYTQRHSFLALCPPPCQAMISSGNCRGSQGFFLYFSFCSGSVLCELSEISLSVMALVRFIGCSPSIKLTAFCSSSPREAPRIPLADYYYIFSPGWFSTHPIPSIRRELVSTWSVIPRGTSG